MTDILYKNPVDLSNNNNNNHSIIHADGDVTFTPKSGRQQHASTLKRPSPQRQRPTQQQSSSPPRSYLPSPNQKFNPQYHFVAVRSHSVDSRQYRKSHYGYGCVSHYRGGGGRDKCCIENELLIQFRRREHGRRRGGGL